MRSEDTQDRGSVRNSSRGTTRTWDGERRTPNRRYSAGDGSGYGSADDSSVRRNNYGERSDSRSSGRFSSNDQRGGGDRPRRTFGNNGNSDSRPFRRNTGERREGGYSNDRREGGYSGERREGGYSGPRREGGYSGERREGGYSGPRREGGYSGPRREGGYSGGNRRDGYSQNRPHKKVMNWERGDNRSQSGSSEGFGGKKLRSRINKKPNLGYSTPDKPAREDGVRLNKFIANSGICSRREADNYIQAGLVTVNDVIITRSEERRVGKECLRLF